MADSKEMPRVDMKKEFPNLNETEKHFIRKIENMNLERAGRLTKMKSRNKLTGVLLAGAVFGIYTYTLLAVKQEKFLDDFDKVPAEN